MATAGDGPGAKQTAITDDPQFTASDLVEALIHLQDQRITAYEDFETGFARHLSGESEFEAYRQLAHTITRKFQLLSEDAADLKQRCSGLGRDDLATAVADIQELEQEKLSLTAKYQLARSSAGRAGVVDDNVKAAKRSLNGVSQSLADAKRDLRLELD